MNEKLIIIGAGGHGKVCADIALNMNQWKEISFLDDNESLDEVLGIKVIGMISKYKELLVDCDFFIAIGNNEFREVYQKRLEENGAHIVTLIHPSAIIGKNVIIEKGTVLMAGVVINPNTKIGKGCIINTNAVVDHDCLIGDYTHISVGSSLAGTVTIGARSFLGIGSIVSNNVIISDDCIIGAGSVVIKNLSKPGTYVGIPVRRL